MKTTLICMMMLLGLATQAQTKTKVFSLSPMTKDTETVNGLVVGIGHFQNAPQTQRINGINVDIMPLSPLVGFYSIMYGTPFTHQKFDDDIKIISNGLNLGISGYLEGSSKHNGLGVTLYNAGHTSNGLTVNGLFNRSKQLHGLHIAGLSNISSTSVGLNLAFYNHSDTMYGAQIGLLNSAGQVKGLQLGLLNRTNALSGLQIGLINVNGKRTLPFLNF